MRLMLLRPANKLRAISVGLKVNVCYAMNEIKANMLAQSCRCEGFATLLTNLMLTDRTADSLATNEHELAKQETWKQMYILGSLVKVVGIVFADEYVGLTFAEACRRVYKDS